MSPERRLVLTFAIPIVGVLLIFNQWVIPGFMRSFVFDHLFLFGVTYWLGLMFSNMYFYMTQDMKEGGASPRTVAITAGIVAFVMLMAAGGPSAIWKTPWLVGAGVMPGIDIAWPVAKEWWLGKKATAGAVVASVGESSLAVPHLTQESSVEPITEEPA